MNDDPIILSEEGRLRQQNILQAALAASQDRKRRTAVIRAAQFCGAAVFIGLALWPAVYSRMGRTTDGMSILKHAPGTGPVPAPTAAAPSVIVQRIETDPTIVQRLSLPPIKSTIRHIGDAELMRELADAHQPAGLISVNGKSQLIFR